MKGSELRASTGDQKAAARVQAADSFGCMPQVHGAARGVIRHVRSVFEVEMNSATDNPLVFDEVISGGNFHGQPLALALDYLAMGLASLAGISERRIERLVNPTLNEDLPAFLAKEPGLQTRLMEAQDVAASLVSRNKKPLHPATVDFITNPGHKKGFCKIGKRRAL